MAHGHSFWHRQRQVDERLSITFSYLGNLRSVKAKDSSKKKKMKCFIHKLKNHCAVGTSQLGAVTQLKYLPSMFEVMCSTHQYSTLSQKEHPN